MPRIHGVKERRHQPAAAPPTVRLVRLAPSAVRAAAVDASLHEDLELLAYAARAAAASSPAPGAPYRGSVPVERKPDAPGRRSRWRRALCRLGLHAVASRGKGDVRTRMGDLHGLTIDRCACGAWRVVWDDYAFSWRRLNQRNPVV
jgi:hypothetical protein